MLVPAARRAECVCDSFGVLTHAEARVLGSLIEKQLTTPDLYPLTLKALTAACNQSSNRDPVMALTADKIETTVLVLKTKGLARVIHPGSGERSTRYRQVADEALRLDDAEQAVIGALLLRGAQTEAHSGPAPSGSTRSRAASWSTPSTAWRRAPSRWPCDWSARPATRDAVGPAPRGRPVRPRGRGGRSTLGRPVTTRPPRRAGGSGGGARGPGGPAARHAG